MAPLTPAAPLVNAHLCPGDQVPRVPAKTMSPVYWPQLCAQWLLRTDPVRHLRRHALYSSTLQEQESSVEGEEESRVSWDPLTAVTFLSADTVFVLPVFLSLSNSVLHSIHFLFFLSASIFSSKTKKFQTKKTKL